MPRAKLQTLTEQMFYILLCLRTPCCGIDLFDRISSMTDGRVTVGSGTLYNLLEQFADAGLICEDGAEGRRRSYRLTAQGEARLRQECDRLRAQLTDYARVFGEEEGR